MKKIMTLIAVSLGIVGSFGILRAMHNAQLHNDGPVSGHIKHDQVSPSKNSRGERLPARIPHQDSSAVLAIEGRVLDGRGKPAAAVDVIAVRSPKGLLLTSKTNKQGYFSIKGVSPGTYEVFTREKNGPTCPSCLFYSGGLPTPSIATVSVLKGQPASNIVLQTAPRLAKLMGRILDAETNKPIVASRITLRRTDNPDFYLEMGADENGNFAIPVPLVPITIGVVSPQHKQWNYLRDDLPPVLMRGGSLKLNRGESRKLEVRLRKKVS